MSPTQRDSGVCGHLLKIRAYCDWKHLSSIFKSLRFWNGLDPCAVKTLGQLPALGSSPRRADCLESTARRRVNCFISYVQSESYS